LVYNLQARLKDSKLLQREIQSRDNRTRNQINLSNVDNTSQRSPLFHSYLQVSNNTLEAVEIKVDPMSNKFCQYGDLSVKKDTLVSNYRQKTPILREYPK
jgi:hypothetical protein